MHKSVWVTTERDSKGRAIAKRLESLCGVDGSIIGHHNHWKQVTCWACLARRETYEIRQSHNTHVFFEKKRGNSNVRYWV